MADKTPKPRLALIFQSRINRRRYDFEPERSWTATVHIVQIEGRAIQSCYDLHKVRGCDLSGLVFESHASDGQTPNELRARYLDSSSSEVSRLKAMARTLEAIPKALGALVERFGYATSLGAEIARVADILGGELVMFERDAQTGYSASQSLEDYELRSPGYAVGRIDAEVAKWLKPLSPTVLVYTTAPESYDGMDTVTSDPDLGELDNGETVRSVVVNRRHLEWQMGRYRSGMHYTSEERPQGLKATVAA